MLALYAIFSAVLVSGIASVIFTDEVLRMHYFAILYICACFFLTFCIITLSRHCKLRRITGGHETVPILHDSDTESLTEYGEESEDEQVTPKTARLLAWLNDYTAFCVWRKPLYGIAVISCLVLWIICRFLIGLFDTEEGFRIWSDPSTAEALLIEIFAVILIVVIIAASYEEYERKIFSYKPFDENIEIPMKVYASKMVAVLMTGQFSFTVGLLIQLVLLFPLVIICDLSEQTISEVFQGSKMRHTCLICMIACVNFAVLYCLIKRFLEARETAKKYLLGIFEKNWHQNLKACEFLLPGIEVNSLEELRLALLGKMNDPQLTKREKELVDYIKRPLWKTKRSLVDTPEDVYPAENYVPPKPQAQVPPIPQNETPPRPQNPPLRSNGSPPSQSNGSPPSQSNGSQSNRRNPPRRARRGN